MRFSQRAGLTPTTKLVQREAMDDELRASLWSLLCIFYWETYRSPGGGYSGRVDFVERSNLQPLIIGLWLHYFKKPTDTIDTFWEHCYEKLRRYYFAAKWYEVYDFIEFIANNGAEHTRVKFIDAVNSYLERENSAYRFIDGKISEITSAEEIREVEDAMAIDDRYTSIKIHLRSALALLSDRKNPDYRNSIKESMSAVESLLKQMTGDTSGTLGAILKELERKKKLHPALKTAFSALYGYTSDADGIRHALLEESNLTKADARLMLICCSAFINYSLDIANSK